MYRPIAIQEMNNVIIKAGSISPKSARKLAIHLEFTLSLILLAITINQRHTANSKKGNGTIPVSSGIHLSPESLSTNPSSQVSTVGMQAVLSAFNSKLTGHTKPTNSHILFLD